MCGRVGCRCLSAQALPWQGGSITDLLTAWGKQARGRYPTDVVSNATSALWHLFTDLRIPKWEKSKTRSASPVSVRSLCVFSELRGNPVLEERAFHHSAWLCCIMTISYAAGNSLLHKSLGSDSRNKKDSIAISWRITAIWELCSICTDFL